ncbi:MAG TPA: hypothetical protein VN612_17555 [Acidobacteriaceae bacterium]|nr:hypothetical protein [Acidobacteriaceae bacterium]
MCKLYVFQTRVGPFFIAYSCGHFRLVHDNEIIGSFGSAEEAARYLAFRRGFLLPSGIDAAILAIPANLARWENCLQVAAGTA